MESVKDVAYTLVCALGYIGFIHMRIALAIFIFVVKCILKATNTKSLEDTILLLLLFPIVKVKRMLLPHQENVVSAILDDIIVLAKPNPITFWMGIISLSFSGFIALSTLLSQFQ